METCPQLRSCSQAAAAAVARPGSQVSLPVQTLLKRCSEPMQLPKRLRWDSPHRRVDCS